MLPNDHTAVVLALLRARLIDRNPHHWTVQGFGMLRTYLDPAQRWRLNVWHAGLAVPGVSTIHDHPWDFTSFVLWGAIKNIVYRQKTPSRLPLSDRPTHHVTDIVTGESGQVIGEERSLVLLAEEHETLYRGAMYCQERSLIHETRATDFTVTLNRRSPPMPEYQARVFWPYGERWVPATPHEATDADLELVTAPLCAQLDLIL